MSKTTTLARTNPITLAQFDAEVLRKICLDALNACENARQKCLAAGQALNDAKGSDALKHGDFVQYRRKLLPEISDDTCERWQRAAANIARFLPPVPTVIDVETISISQILTMPDEELSGEAREWKQLWFEFTSNKTIKECLNGVFVEGDDAHRIDRAINGKTKGGTGGDRKDFSLFVSVKLKDMAAHFSHWGSMSEQQRTEIKMQLASAIKGEPTNLRKRPFNFAPWPEEICRVAQEALRDRLKAGAKQSSQ